MQRKSAVFAAAFQQFLRGKKGGTSDPEVTVVLFVVGLRLAVVVPAFLLSGVASQPPTGRQSVHAHVQAAADSNQHIQIIIII